ncbi:MAG: hypothetical protein CFE31_19000 [Rhizobiales bacterium PAR1]|nr:MAG: hypothetical protein CFE31_19000 [Rhizobiales bacterium PAR1]
MSASDSLTARQIREIAHELRAPLGGIEAMVEMLEGSALDADQARMVVALKASVAHLRGIAGAVLGAPGWNEAAPASAARRPLGAVLAEIEAAGQARARSKGLSFAIHGADETLRNVLVESMELRQVLENLVDNAFRLTTRGGVDLYVSRASAGRIGFHLVDDGPGLQALDAARLIRSGGGIEGRSGGAGIGLSIAGRLVAERGGALSGGPAGEGRGAAFTFDWPDEPASSKGTCLIVDDHPASRLVLKTILGAAGYRCLEAGRPEEALTVIAASSPEIVLTDLNMPEGGGMALIAEIAAISTRQRPRLLVVSADDLDPAEPLSREVDGAIRKPITVRAVLEAMVKLERRPENPGSETCAA